MDSRAPSRNDAGCGSYSNSWVRLGFLTEAVKEIVRQAATSCSGVTLVRYATFILSLVFIWSISIEGPVAKVEKLSRILAEELASCIVESIKQRQSKA